MALKINKTLNNGVEATECYVKVACLERCNFFTPGLEGKVEKTIVSVVLYYSEEARLDKKQPLSTSSYTINEKLNSFEEIYNYLKTLDEYQGAEDV